MFAGSGASTQAADPASRPTTLPTSPLISAAELKAMPLDQVARTPTVRVRGSLTYLANQPSILFVQDPTGGVCVFGPREAGIRRSLKVGAVIEVEGIVLSGRGGPYLSAKPKEPLAITVFDETELLPPRPVAIADVLTLRGAGELVEVHGTCRSARIESFGPLQEALVVTVVEAGQRLEVAYLNWSNASILPKTWVGARVRVRGVFNSTVPDRQQVASMRLLVAAMRDVAIVNAATPAAALPLSPTTSIEAVPADETRVRVQGVVTLPVAGKGMYVQDDGGGVWVDVPDRQTQARIGEKVDVVGFPLLRDGSPILEDAIWESMGAAQLPSVIPVTADEALSGTYNSRRIQMDALVLEISRFSEGSTMVLQAGERVFLARLAGPADASQTIPAAENSWVRVSGVCVNNRAPRETSPDRADVWARPVSFHLMLAGPDAVSVIRAPNWWTLERVLVVIGLLLLSALAAMAWVVALRRRVTQQTVQISRHVQQETLNEERMRIARELHDSLEQDLLGITMQLKATEKLLDRPERARTSLQLASAMVRRSQAETHRAVWDLRERKVGQEGLVPTLRSALAGLTSGAGTTGGPEIEVEVSGQERELPPQMENHLLRVALESVTNAFKHASARTVRVKVDFEDNRVVLRVTDDGKGFDADHPPAPVSGHFGLFGMNERAAKLHGTLTITSRSGEGTSIHLIAPTNGTTSATAS
ncbi:sensor histidine kinase [Humisphaera borealis]|uniref:Sensor histidine kinase n=1 Tax=Humisphaera borealis TaxID=2807512 RepID=A0A7M2WPX9_9BACT|nr:sensor histidine kinase [Humisphaera borealis]QOV87459.1 sensor histidine kinase [Humisphaera borealis]